MVNNVILGDKMTTTKTTKRKGITTLTAAQKSALKIADDLLTKAKIEILGVYDELPPNDDWDVIGGMLDSLDDIAFRLAVLFSEKEGN